MVAARIYKPEYPFVLNRASKQAVGVAHWFPGGIGSNVLFDMAGKGDNGMRGGSGQIWVSGVDSGLGASIYDGSTNFFLCNANITPDFSGPMSISAWIKPTTTSGTQVICSRGENTANFVQYQLEINRTAGKVGAAWGGDAGYALLNGNTTVSTTSWQHIGWTRTLNAGTWTCQFFYNGLPDGTRTVTNNPSVAHPPYRQVIGCAGFTPTTPIQLYSGQMEELKVYRFPLTNSEMWDQFDPHTRYDLRYKLGRKKFLLPPTVATGIPNQLININQAVKAAAFY